MKNQLQIFVALGLFASVTTLAFPLKMPPQNTPVKTSIPKNILELRSQARINLGALYTVEKAYLAENDLFTEDFIHMGWSPYSDVAPFQLGFLTLSGESKLPDSLITSDAKGISLTEYAKYCKADCRVHDKHFEAILILPLGQRGRVDVWTIDDEKNLELRHDGLND